MSSWSGRKKKIRGKSLSQDVRLHFVKSSGKKCENKHLTWVPSFSRCLYTAFSIKSSASYTSLFGWLANGRRSSFPSMKDNNILLNVLKFFFFIFGERYKNWHLPHCWNLAKICTDLEEFGENPTELIGTVVQSVSTNGLRSTAFLSETFFNQALTRSWEIAISLKGLEKTSYIQRYFQRGQSFQSRRRRS